MDEPALRAARRAVAAAPDQPAPLFRLCSLLLQHGDPEANRIVPLLERHASFAPGWCELGVTLWRARQGAAALLAFTRAANADPDLATAHAGRGLCLRQSGDYEAALTALERAVALDAAQVDAWFALGGLRQDRRQHEGAIAAYRAALRIKPDLHEAAFNLGVACLELARLDDALSAFAEALRTRPASFGRIAQALVSGPTGCLWLDPAGLRRVLVDLAA